MQSPITAWRPWPSVSGPVGFADTNSTWTRAPAAAAARRVAVARAHQLARARAASTRSSSQTFRKPGPATSARATSPPASPSRAASSLGDLPRRAAQRLREQQGGVAGEVAVLGLTRHLEAVAAARSAAEPASARSSRTQPSRASRRRSFMRVRDIPRRFGASRNRALRRSACAAHAHQRLAGRAPSPSSSRIARSTARSGSVRSAATSSSQRRVLPLERARLRVLRLRDFRPRRRKPRAETRSRVRTHA